MLDFCHRDYFRRFRLNVEQYGEILVAQAFCGLKMGDEQVGYDVKVPHSAFVEALRTAGVNVGQLPTCAPDDDVRIEVKSKLSHTLSGKAEVIGVKATKIEGVQRGGRKHLGMTHLAVVLVYPGSRASRDAREEGFIADAWLLTRERVITLRDNTKRKGKSLSVKEIRDILSRESDIISIKPLVEAASQAPLLDAIAKGTVGGVAVAVQ
jgi:hypothetical protein